MKRFLAVAGLISSLLAASAAIAHDPPAQEPQRACKPYRPNTLTPTMSPVEAHKDSNGNNITGICTTAGVVRVGTTSDGVFVAADGSRGADVAPSDAPEETHWTKGYVLITGNTSGEVHGYCAGGGQYENGAQPDDEMVTGDCSIPAPSSEPEPSESPSPEPTTSESPSPDPTTSESPAP